MRHKKKSVEAKRRQRKAKLKKMAEMKHQKAVEAHVKDTPASSTSSRIDDAACSRTIVFDDFGNIDLELDLSMQNLLGARKPSESSPVKKPDSEAVCCNGSAKKKRGQYKLFDVRPEVENFEVVLSPVDGPPKMSKNFLNSTSVSAHLLDFMSSPKKAAGQSPTKERVPRMRIQSVSPKKAIVLHEESGSSYSAGTPSRGLDEDEEDTAKKRLEVEPMDSGCDSVSEHLDDKRLPTFETIFDDEDDNNATSMTPTPTPGDILQQALNASFGSEKDLHATANFTEAETPISSRFISRKLRAYVVERDNALPLIGDVLSAYDGSALSQNYERMRADRGTNSFMDLRSAAVSSMQTRASVAPSDDFLNDQADASEPAAKKRREGKESTPKCRACGGALRLVDKHREDGRYALHCRKRNCLKFNGFTDDFSLKERLKRPKRDYDWYLSDPVKYYYKMRTVQESDSDDDDVKIKRRATGFSASAPLYQNSYLMVRCPGQKKLCRLL